MPVLKNFTDFYSYSVGDQVAYNLQRWLEWGMAEAGAYTLVSFNNPATSGYTNLKRVDTDHRYASGRLYEGLSSWIWQGGIQPLSGALAGPTVASGVWVNNVFYNSATTSGLYSHAINYRDGMVLFNNPVSGSVKCEYTINDVSVEIADGKNWRLLIEEYEKNYNALETLSPSGMAQILKSRRVWLPSVFIDVQNRTNAPLQLGGGDINNFVVGFHVFSDKPFSSRRIADILCDQYQHTLTFFNTNASGAFPYTASGTLASGALTYPQLIDGNGPYAWTMGHISETDGGSRPSSSNVYRSEVTMAVDLERYVSTF